MLLLFLQQSGVQCNRRRYIFEIYELAQEIAAPPTIPHPVERKITTKEEFREAWFNL